MFSEEEHVCLCFLRWWGRIGKGQATLLAQASLRGVNRSRQGPVVHTHSHIYTHRHGQVAMILIPSKLYALFYTDTLGRVLAVGPNQMLASSVSLMWAKGSKQWQLIKTEILEHCRATSNWKQTSSMLGADQHPRPKQPDAYTAHHAGIRPS